MAYNKIHVNSSTGLSLNDRFTAMAERTTELRQRQPSRSRSRSRSLVRELQPVHPITSHANRRLLMQLERRHKMLAAMRVKRKSLRSTASAGYLKRGSIKATRVAANGRPIIANSLTKVATMKADLIGNTGRHGGGGGGGRPFRRFDSATNISQRLGVNRVVGGAAERIEKRRLARLRKEISRNAATDNIGRNGNAGVIRRGRSRSRTRLPANNANGNFNNKAGITAALTRGRSRSRSRNRLQNNVRSQSRNRAATAAASRNNLNVRRGRSMSRNRDNRADLPIKARLGVRPSANGRSNSTAGNRQRRDQSINRQRNQKVLRGRVEKRGVAAGGRATNGQQRFNGNGGRVPPTRGRARSRTRKGQQQDRQRLQLQQRQVRGGQNNRQALGRRGRSRQRGISNNNNNGNSNNRKGNGMRNGQRGKQQQQKGRRGRSLSRRGGGRNLGQNTKSSNVNKEDLDKELDQYMATTKNENDLDFLLKN